MKDKFAFLVWVSATIVFAYAIVTAYNTNHKREMAAVYDCYISAYNLDGSVAVNKQFTQSGEELSKVQKGNTFMGLTVDVIGTRYSSYYFKYSSPNIANAKMSCFKQDNK